MGQKILKGLLVVILAVLIASCGTIKIEKRGWSALDTLQFTEQALDALQASMADTAIIRLKDLILIETVCKASYTSWFRKLDAIKGNVCGGAVSADQVSSEVDLNALIQKIALEQFMLKQQQDTQNQRRQLSAPQGGRQ